MKRQRLGAIAGGVLFGLALACGLTAMLLHAPELFDRTDYDLAVEERSLGHFVLGPYQVDVNARKSGSHSRARELGWSGDGLPHTRVQVNARVTVQRDGHDAELRQFATNTLEWSWGGESHTHDADREASAHLTALRFESCIDAGHERMAFRFLGEPLVESGWHVLAAFPELVVTDYVDGIARCEDALAVRAGTDWIVRGVAAGNVAALELAGRLSLVLPELLDYTIAHRIVWQGGYDQDPPWQERLHDAMAAGSTELGQRLFADLAPGQEPEPGPRGNARLDEWVGQLMDAYPDVPAKQAFARRLRASCDTDFAPCAAPFRVRAMAVAGRSDPALCESILDLMPRVLGSGRPDVETSGLALLHELHSCAGPAARERAARAVLSAPEAYPAEPVTPGLAHMVDFDSCVGPLASPPVDLRYCNSLAVLATWEYAPPCPPAIVALAPRFEARAVHPWDYAALTLLDHCGEQESLSALAVRLRSQPAWSSDHLLDRMSAPPAP